MNLPYSSINLSPSESLLLLHPANASHKQLVKLSMMELLHMKVLSVNRESAGLKDAPQTKYYFVSRGENFDNFDLKPHLEFLRIPFIEKSRKIALQLFIPLCFKTSDHDLFSYKYYCLYKPLVSEGYFNDSFLRKFMIYLYTDKGRIYKRDLSATLKEANENIKSWMQSDHSKVVNLINMLGLNILLLENLDTALMKEISRILGLLNKADFDDSWSSWGYYDFGYTDFPDLPDSSFEFGGGDFGGGGAGGDWDIDIGD
jgi:hypothetical protein